MIFMNFLNIFMIFLFIFYSFSFYFDFHYKCCLKNRFKTLSWFQNDFVLKYLFNVLNNKLGLSEILNLKDKTRF